VIILGIDPGLNRLGYGAVDDAGGKLVVIECGVVASRRTFSFEEKLAKIASSLEAVVDRTRPAVLAIEEIFLAENVQTALKIGQVMGLVMGLGLRRKIGFVQIPVREIKQNLVGAGGATKEQVQFMVARLTGRREFETPDASDAVAVAISYSNTRRLDDLVARGNRR